MPQKTLWESSTAHIGAKRSHQSAGFIYWLNCSSWMRINKPHLCIYILVKKSTKNSLSVNRFLGTFLVAELLQAAVFTLFPPLLWTGCNLRSENSVVKCTVGPMLGCSQGGQLARVSLLDHLQFSEPWFQAPVLGVPCTCLHI